jgi:hypothetical protein
MIVTPIARLALATVSLAALAAVAGCGQPVKTGTTPPPTITPSVTATVVPHDALDLCKQALPGRDVVSGSATTVGALRDWGYGGPVAHHPLATVFATAAPTATAAWCWTKEAADSYTAWGVLAPGSVAQAINITGPIDQPPSGAPVIP